MSALYSEPYAPTGNIGDSGLRRLLGTPTSGVFETIVRESLQNSCDAAKLGRGPKVVIRLRHLSRSQQLFLENRVFDELPLGMDSRDLISKCISSDSVAVLEICDFGTSGLGGPTRADRVPDEDSPTDFIDFLRNVGSARDSVLGGGTYGFGKASFYSGSDCSTILVDTLVAGNAGESRRFMGCHLGAAYGIPNQDGTSQRFTGRHWWGAKDEITGMVDPVLGSAAVNLVKSLGMLDREETGETGTSIMVLCPVTGEDSLLEVGKQIRSSVLVNFWPRMTLDCPESMRLDVSIEVDDCPLDVPKPEECPPLNLYAEALGQIRSGAEDVEEIMCRRPSMVLGHLAISKGLRVQRHSALESVERFDGSCASIAGMRPVGMVVKEFPGGKLPGETMDWAGVFVVSHDSVVEKAFAAAEPPAHDDWQPSILPKGTGKTFVTVGLREVKLRARGIGDPQGGDGFTEDARNHDSVTMAAEKIGTLLEKSSLPTKRMGKGRKGARTKIVRVVSAPDFHALIMVESEKVALFRVKVNASSGQMLELVAKPFLSVEGGLVDPDKAPVGSVPRIILIRNEAGEELGDEGIALINGKYEGLVEIGVTMPGNYAVSLDVEANALESSK